MAQSTSQKLGIKPGMTVVATGLAGSAVEAILGSLPDAAMLSPAGPSADVALLFVDTLDDVRARASDAWSSVAPDRRLWVAYRKGASKRGMGAETPLHRDTLQAALAEVGLTGVTLVALDDVWSALRVKPLG
ncbi:MAG TPA: hypothetical protein VGM94_13190 [Galbitalea sp.]|jgi:hypothetical protein